jgi:hypothetical protein
VYNVPVTRPRRDEFPNHFVGTWCQPSRLGGRAADVLPGRPRLRLLISWSSAAVNLKPCDVARLGQQAIGGVRIRPCSRIAKRHTIFGAKLHVVKILLFLLAEPTHIGEHLTVWLLLEYPGRAGVDRLVVGARQLWAHQRRNLCLAKVVTFVHDYQTDCF